MPSPYTLADAEWWIAHNQDRANWQGVRSFDANGVETLGPKLPARFAITAPNQQGEDEAIGGIGLDMGVDVARRSAELGYWLAEPEWGKGIMPDVVTALLEWVWEAFPGLVRVHSEVFALNERSASVLKRVGFDYESRQRAAVFKNGVIGDALVYVKLRPGLQY
jgi:RimJ/RimL family protein N-acetyltransferase